MTPCRITTYDEEGMPMNAAAQIGTAVALPVYDEFDIEASIG